MNRRIAIVLAAGQGTRMRSQRPKVLHEICGRPSLGWVLEACRGAGCEAIHVVVGAGAEQVRGAFPDADLHWIEQRERRGTGHAVQIAFASLAEQGALDQATTALIVYADNPLMTAAGLQRLAEVSERDWASLAVATLDDPGALGRVERDREGRLLGLVEFADATAEQRAIRQVNAGQYAIPLAGFAPYLERLEPGNAQGELYLTDAFVHAARDGRPVRCVDLESPSEAWGINDRSDLAKAHAEFRRRIVADLLRSGVTVLDPDRVTIGPDVRIAPDVVLHPGVWIGGETTLGAGCVVHQGAWLRDAHLDEGVEVHPYSVLDGARVGAGCAIGPFARLRPGSELAEQVRVGNFVEVKKSRLGRGAKANHLAYVGDAEVGERTNIGAGVVTCNYDGHRKHRTEIGDDAFVGSDTMLVAPVSVGSRSITGAGSVITDDVPDDSLALGRARQRNLVGWTRRSAAQGEEKASSEASHPPQRAQTGEPEDDR
ncbi:MAG: UDP-N-acetylglucosamine diphosphorylase/glucosamine-1-phosphate N-acetyltransferase [Acidobacteria bacterium]|nr:MAG: UDP-N-acetylglucosamine diphosphorylase/glucosamine-1-phosphate N-acetyltransferase [Acidobacteriota bacterium]